MTSIKDEDLPERLKKQQNVAHLIAQNASPQIWNLSLESLYKISPQITGNDALSYFGTIICDFVGLWIVNMNKIAQQDDAGITAEDLIKDMLNGILETIGAEAKFEEEPELPDGIKRLRKENEQ